MAQIEIIKQKGFNFLWIDDELWMWDIPIENECQKQIADQAFGNVLIAGYGLGVVQKFCKQNKNIKSILTIELYPEVLEVNKKEYGGLCHDVLCRDFYKYTTSIKFDCIIGDIWEDIVPQALENYKKFKKKAQELIKPDGKILAWGQDYFEYLIEKEKR